MFKCCFLLPFYFIPKYFCYYKTAVGHKKGNKRKKTNTWKALFIVTTNKWRFLTGNYMFRVNNRNTRTCCEICSTLIIKAACSSLAIVNFEQVNAGWVKGNENSFPLFLQCHNCCNDCSFPSRREISRPVVSIILIRLA